MVNLDYPGYCPTCGEKCPLDKNVAHDLDAVRTREHAAASGYTKTLANNLKDAFPDRIKTDEEAMMVLDVFETSLVNGLKNNNIISIQGLGTFRPDKHLKTVVFTPDSALVAGVLE